MKFNITIGPIDAKKLPEVLGVLTEWAFPYSAITEHMGPTITKRNDSPHMPKNAMLKMGVKNINIYGSSTRTHKVALTIKTMLKAQKGGKLSRSTILRVAAKETGFLEPNISSMVSKLLKDRVLAEASKE